MQEEIEQVREQGYAVDNGEEIKDVHCIGVPIFDYRHHPIAAIWIVGPEYRLTKETYPDVGKIVKEQALKISKRFGYDPG